MTDIYHSGIKGQKRGVRRYQYLNGTYTREGNLRYRPPKNYQKFGKAVITNALIGEAAVMLATKAVNSVSTMSLSSVMSSMHSGAVAIGKAVTTAYLTMPLQLRLPLTIAFGGIAAFKLMLDGEDMIKGAIDKVKNLDIDKVRDVGVGYGAPLIGGAITAVSGNPIPVFAGMTIGTLSKLLKEE